MSKNTITNGRSRSDLSQVSFTPESWIEALYDAQDQGEDDGALTAQEIAEHSGIGIKTVYKALKRLKSQGRIDVVEIRRENLVGRRVPVPAYKLVKG